MIRWARAAAAAAVLLALVIGVPALLAGTIGNPADGWADLRAGDLTDTALLDLLAVVVWVAWAQFAVSVVAELAGALRLVARTPSLPLVPGFSQQLARRLVAAVLLVGAVTATLTPTAHAVAAPAAPPAAAASPAQTPAGAPAAATGTVAPSPPAVSTKKADRAAPVYVVPPAGHGPDTYWDIAEAYCGGGQHWTQVWQLNQGRSQPDGEVMTQTGLLKPGWTVLLPAGSTLPAAATPASGPHAATETVTVVPGDTLSGIAAAHGVTDWHQTWEQNRGEAEPHGQHFTDPDLIRPGWTLQVTDTAIPAAPAPAAPPAVQAPPARQPLPARAHDPAPPDPAPTAAASGPADQATSAPAKHRAGTGDAPSRTAGDGDGDSVSAPLLGFATGGGLLAALSLAALVRYRRRQFRWRQPGRSIGVTPPDLAPAERTVLAAGGAAAADVDWLNRALRSLTHTIAAAGDSRLPDVAAARLSPAGLDLVLTGRHDDPPAPWRADAAGTCWTVDRDAELRYDPAAATFALAPYPTLVCVGYTEDGQQWLLDLERLGAVSLTGDSGRCLALARFMAAELAHNSWSELLQVTVVGFGAELAQINPDRLSYAADAQQALHALHAQVQQAGDEGNGGVLPGRLHGSTGDLHAPHVLLLDPSAADPETVGELLVALRARQARTAVALVLADDRQHTDQTRWQLQVTDQGRLLIPTLGLDLIAQQIPAGEADELARLLAMAADTADAPMPAAHGSQPWDGYADAAGGLRVAVRPVAADAAPADPAAVTGLRLAGAGTAADGGAPWLQQTASTAADVQRLAPPVDEEIRRQVETADGGLDADLASWYDPHCKRPKVTLLGPVQVRAQGDLPDRNPRQAWNTEVVAYLATRAGGVSSERYGTDLWPDDPDIVGKTKVRQSVLTVRRWLGADPDTGQEYVPKATASGTAGTYRLVGHLVDAELFRRLRVRGVARGPDGIADLQAALDLVSGMPFDQRRPGGYGWLADMPLDHEYAAMIVDVAHTVATHHLAGGQPGRAVAAAQVALRAGSSEDVPLLDLVAACDAQDNRAEADAFVQRILANHDAEVEEDLPPRTAAILWRRQQLGRAG